MRENVKKFWPRISKLVQDLEVNFFELNTCSDRMKTSSWRQFCTITFFFLQKWVKNAEELLEKKILDTVTKTRNSLRGHMANVKTVFANMNGEAELLNQVIQGLQCVYENLQDHLPEAVSDIMNNLVAVLMTRGTTFHIEFKATVCYATANLKESVKNLFQELYCVKEVKKQGKEYLKLLRQVTENKNLEEEKEQESLPAFDEWLKKQKGYTDVEPLSVEIGTEMNSMFPDPELKETMSNWVKSLPQKGTLLHRVAQKAVEQAKEVLNDAKISLPSALSILDPMSENNNNTHKEGAGGDDVSDLSADQLKQIDDTFIKRKPRITAPGMQFGHHRGLSGGRKLSTGQSAQDLSPEQSEANDNIQNETVEIEENKQTSPETADHAMTEGNDFPLESPTRDRHYSDALESTSTSTGALTSQAATSSTSGKKRRTLIQDYDDNEPTRQEQRVGKKVKKLIEGEENNKLLNIVVDCWNDAAKKKMHPSFFKDVEPPLHAEKFEENDNIPVYQTTTRIVNYYQNAKKINVRYNNQTLKGYSVVKTPLSKYGEIFGVKPTTWTCVEEGCQETFSSLYELKAHCVVSHGAVVNSPAVCAYCCKVFPLGEDAEKKRKECEMSHFAVGVGNDKRNTKSFICVKCYFQKDSTAEYFPSRALLMAHLIAKHQQTSPFHCAVTDERCANEAKKMQRTYENLKKEKISWACQVCPKRVTFKSYEEKLDHFDANHPNLMFHCYIPRFGLKRNKDIVKLYPKVSDELDENMSMYNEMGEADEAKDSEADDEQDDEEDEKRRRPLTRSTTGKKSRKRVLLNSDSSDDDDDLIAKEEVSGKKRKMKDEEEEEDEENESKSGVYVVEVTENDRGSRIMKCMYCKKTVRNQRSAEFDQSQLLSHITNIHSNLCHDIMKKGVKIVPAKD